MLIHGQMASWEDYSSVMPASITIVFHYVKQYDMDDCFCHTLHWEQVPDYNKISVFLMVSAFVRRLLSL